MAEPTESAAEPSPSGGVPYTGDARKDLAAAVDQLVAANSGSYFFQAPFGPGVAVTEKGSYSLDPLLLDGERTVEQPGFNIKIAYRALTDRSWFKINELVSKGQPPVSWACWVDLADLPELADGPQGQLPAPRPGATPVELTFLTASRGARYPDSITIAGTTDLYSTLALISGNVAAAVGLDARKHIRVPATFSMDADGGLSGISVMFRDIPPAIAKAGIDTPPEVADFAELPTSVSVLYTDAGAAVDVDPPTPVAVVQDGQSFDDAMKTCA